MRLAGCIALEVVVGASLLSGMGVGTYYGVQALGFATQQRAYAAEITQSSTIDPGLLLEEIDSAPAAPATEKPLEAPVVVEERRPELGMFRGVRDDYLLKPLREGGIRRVRVNRGGSSLSLRVDLVGGGRAAFKPDQTNLQTIPRREVAAFRVNRLLGLTGVPPAIARSFLFQDLVDNLQPSDRALAPRLYAEIRKSADGMVAGELSWWIPTIVDATIGGYKVDSMEGVVTWKRYLRVDAEYPPQDEQLLARISSMVAFDFLINNTDRWSGANCKGSPDGRYLYYMDNTLAFGPEPQGHPKVMTYLTRVQRFSASMVRELRRLHRDDLQEVATKDTGPYRAILSSDEIDAVLARRDVLVDYIDTLIAEHGETAVLVFP